MAQAALKRDTAGPSLLDGLKAYYQDYYAAYHMEYPRLLAEGLARKEIAKRLDKDPDIVEFHLERLYGHLPHLRRSLDAAALADALREFDRWPKPPKPDVPERPAREFSYSVPSRRDPREAAREARQLAAQERKRADRAEATPSAAPAPAAPASLPVAQQASLQQAPPPPPPPARAPPAKPERAYDGTEPGDPTDEELVASINTLSAGQRRILGWISLQSEPPSAARTASALHLLESSAATQISAIYAQLGLPSPHKSGREERAVYRHHRVKAALLLPGVQPPRESMRGVRKREEVTQASPSSALHKRVEERLGKLSRSERMLLDAILEFAQKAPTASELIDVKSRHLKSWIAASMAHLFGQLDLLPPDGANESDWSAFRQKLLRDLLGVKN